MRKINWSTVVGVVLICASMSLAVQRMRGQYVFDTITATTITGTTVTLGSTLTLGNSDTLDTTTDATFDFTRDDAGTVTITASDNDATAALTVSSGGNAAALFDAGHASATATLGSTAGTAAICNSAGCDTINIGTNTDADTITIGESNDTAVSITDNNWSIGAGGIALFAYQRRTVGSALSTADTNLAKATLQAANVFPVNTGSNAVDVDFADDAALDAADVGSQWQFIVTTGHATQALTVTAGASGVTTVVSLAALGATCEDVGDQITCTAYSTSAITCVSVCAD